jgi:hypothetical protein
MASFNPLAVMALLLAATATTFSLPEMATTGWMAGPQIPYREAAMTRLVAVRAMTAFMAATAVTWCMAMAIVAQEMTTCRAMPAMTGWLGPR